MWRAALILAVLVAVPAVAHAQQLQRDAIVHLSGCNDRGELEVPLINVFESPPPARVTHQLTGRGPDRPGERCDGALVRVVAVRQTPARTFYRVASIVNGRIGWVSELFMGKRRTVQECRAMVDRPEQQRRCGEP